MKKIMCLISAMFFLSSNINAQLIADDFRLGFYVAPGIDWFGTQNNDILTNGAGNFGFGLITDIYLADNFIIGSGINAQWFKGDVDIQITDTIGVGAYRSGTYKLGYLEIPLTIKLMTNDVGYLRYFGQLGGFLGFPLLKKRYDFTVNDVLTEDNEQLIKRVVGINLGISASIGAEYALTENTSGYAALWLNKGFTPALKNRVFEDDFFYNDSDNKVTTGVVSLRLGVIF